MNLQRKWIFGRLLLAWIGWMVFCANGCTVGPNFMRPSPPQDRSYTGAPIPKAIAPHQGEAGQRIHIGERISSQWWELFRVPALNEVLHSAVAGNRSLASARATLAAARETAAAAKGAYFPQVDASTGFNRRRPSAHAPEGSSAGSAPISDLYSVGLNVSYALDVFGATRRNVEQQQALTAFQGYELAAAYLTLTGNAVTQAITIASLRAQIQATQDVIADDGQNLALVRRKFEAGKVARTDVLSAETQLASDRTLLPPLQQKLSLARHTLSVLTGRAPAEWSPPDFDLKDFVLPGDIPLTLPSKLVRQRPDILAAEARLHADSAAIGVATARLYPNITLSGSLGQEALAVGALSEQVNRYWDLAAGLTAPIFHGGTLRAEKRAAVDTYQATLATYQQTVLQAFEQVADTLQALSHDAELIAADHQLLQTAGTALKLQRLSYAAGKSDVLQLISAERAYQEAQLGYVRTAAQRLLDTAELFTALGGGWWNATGISR